MTDKDKKATKSREVKSVDVPIEVTEKAPNDFSKRIEKGEKVYFKWNGASVATNITLLFNHVYSFDEIPDLAKVKVIDSFGKKRKVSHPDVRGYRGFLVDSKYGNPNDITKAKMLDHSNGEKVVEVQDPANWNRNIKIPKMHLPFVEVDVVEEISEEEFLFGKSQQFSRTTPRNESRRDRVA